jgi:hypothetical protein
MKTTRLIFAILAALWTLGVAAGVVSNLGKHDGTRGLTEAAGGIAALAIAIGITVWLFQGVFPKLRKPPFDYDPKESSEAEEKSPD